MEDPGTAARVAFLRRPEAWPEATREVEVEETHMAWVFLTDRSAYKLKKPTKAEDLDFSTPERRRLDGQEEVRLNRRLAGDVYRGTLVLTRDVQGRLAVGGPGEAIDWLVSMVRLPAGETLEARIGKGRVEEGELRTVARLLADFHGRAAPVELGGPEHRARLARGTEADRRELSRPEFGLSRARVDALADAQRAFLDRAAALFDARVARGRVVEGHGDLRPEHVWVAPRPVVIDCLEFSRDLRLVDAVDEIAFLELECARLGDAATGARLRALWTAASGDDAPDALWRFHRTYRALRRAKIALWHLDDHAAGDPERWRRRARRYLELAAPPGAEREEGAASAGAGPSS